MNDLFETRLRFCVSKTARDKNKISIRIFEKKIFRFSLILRRRKFSGSILTERRENVSLSTVKRFLLPTKQISRFAKSKVRREQIRRDFVRSVFSRWETKISLIECSIDERRRNSFNKWSNQRQLEDEMNDSIFSSLWICRNALRWSYPDCRSLQKSMFSYSIDKTTVFIDRQTIDATTKNKNIFSTIKNWLFFLSTNRFLIWSCKAARFSSRTRKFSLQRVRSARSFGARTDFFLFVIWSFFMVQISNSTCLIEVHLIAFGCDIQSHIETNKQRRRKSLFDRFLLHRKSRTVLENVTFLVQVKKTTPLSFSYGRL